MYFFRQQYCLQKVYFKQNFIIHDQVPSNLSCNVTKSKDISVKCANLSSREDGFQLVKPLSQSIGLSAHPKYLIPSLPTHQRSRLLKEFFIQQCTALTYNIPLCRISLPFFHPKQFNSLAGISIQKLECCAKYENSRPLSKMHLFKLLT